MQTSRRHFLQTGAVALVGATLPWSSARALGRSDWTTVTVLQAVDTADYHALLHAAIEAANAAGAEYADVQFRAAKSQGWTFPNTRYMSPSLIAFMGVGVRVLVNGYWGLAAMNGLPTPELMAQLGRDAVAQARTGAKGPPREVALATVPVVQGEWHTPVEIDPFTVDDGEKIDFTTSLNDRFLRRGFGLGSTLYLTFRREERFFASTQGSLTRQTLIRSNLDQMLMPEPHFSNGGSLMITVPLSTMAGGGWEYIRKAPLDEQADELIDLIRRIRVTKPVDIGRYDVVFDAQTMGNILDGTLGEGTRLDRAMGFQANTDGTSFLSDPLGMLGTLRVASPKITVAANRNLPGGTATVKWDDEGVEPDDITLVREGVLTDFQTSRESASWLADYYQRTNQPIRSHGCAGSDLPTMPQEVRSGNLVLQPGAEDLTFDDLIADTEKGLAVMRGSVDMDHQCLNGAGSGIVREIKHGKLGDVISGANYLLRAPEFWKHVVGLGGARSVETFGLTRRAQYSLGGTLGGYNRVESYHSVSAVPAKVSEMAIIDVARKAPEPEGV